MKIYTRKGDKGTTQLIGGLRVPKHHIRIEAYGTIDELNAHVGLLRDQQGSAPYKEALEKIQNKLFTIGSLLAEQQGGSGMKLPALSENDVTELENFIDQLEEGLPEMKSFVLPGGHPSVSVAHITRCVCRRAERTVSYLDEKEKVDGIIIKYLNRLSDMLFMMSRRLSHDLGAEEIPWKPNLDE